MLYELRRYEVTPGKMPALLERFADFTVPKWGGVGFRLVGFWTPDIGGPSNELTYMLGWESLEERSQKFETWHAAPGRAERWAESEKDGPLVKRVHNMLLQPTAFSQLDRGIPHGPSPEGRAPYLFELRTYEAMPGKLRNIVRRFGDFTADRFAHHGFRQVGYWTPVIGGHSHMLIYMLAWESHEERTKKFGEFRVDPERARVFDESEKDGQLVERVSTALLRPAAFSPIR
ncbi:MAG: NIPSNAP family protein [Chloroflexota bacterium]